MNSLNDETPISFTFVEYFGDGVSRLTVADRATIANMSPEYGATCGYFPVDDQTLQYLRLTGRPESRIRLVEAYCKANMLWYEPLNDEREYSEILELDLGTVVPSIAGPRRPQDRIALVDAKRSFTDAFATVETRGDGDQLDHGSIVIAAITSCTNTSNPSGMLAAALLAKNAVEAGLVPQPWVKTSLAPGSRAVTEYYARAGLDRFLEQLGFHTVGYGCTTCVGNSGPLAPEVEQSIRDRELVVCAVLSGNRNFEARIHPAVRATYLASPALVIAFALAGRIDIDMLSEPIAQGVYLRDIWPSSTDIQRAVASSVKRDLFTRAYGGIGDGIEEWQTLDVPEGDRFPWQDGSLYIRRPPFLDGVEVEPRHIGDIEGARCLVMAGDSVTTDHISPVGAIPAESPAGSYLSDAGVSREDCNSYGSRRVNHDVMARGTFANVRMRNRLVPGSEGGWTVHLPSQVKMSIFDAAQRYASEGVPTIVIAGSDYGVGSSRDWAAKGLRLLGVRAVLAESFERIHRSNLLMMGIIPLQFTNGESVESLGLTGRETFSIRGVAAADAEEVEIRADDVTFMARVRLDTRRERDYLRHGGILPYVLRQKAGGGADPDAAVPTVTLEEAS